MSQYELSAQIIQRAFKRFKKSPSLSKCFNCRNPIGFRDKKMVLACEQKNGTYSHKDCSIKNVNDVCPFCYVKVKDRYVSVKSIYGNVKRPEFVHELNNGVIQKWHRECHKVMTYGFENKNKVLNDLDRPINKGSRGSCLVCGDEVTDKTKRYQVVNTQRGTIGTYVHGKCYTFWINPKFTLSNSKIKVVEANDNFTYLEVN